MKKLLLQRLLDLIKDRELSIIKGLVDNPIPNSAPYSTLELMSFVHGWEQCYNALRSNSITQSRAFEDETQEESDEAQAAINTIFEHNDAFEDYDRHMHEEMMKEINEAIKEVKDVIVVEGGVIFKHATGGFMLSDKAIELILAIISNLRAQKSASQTLTRPKEETHVYKSKVMSDEELYANRTSHIDTKGNFKPDEHMFTLTEDQAMGQHTTIEELYAEYHRKGYKYISEYMHPAVGKCIQLRQPTTVEFLTR